MKKPTTLRTLIFVLALLFNFASYSQNWVAFNSKLNSSSNGNLFLKANNQFNGQFGLGTNSENEPGKPAAAMVNPAIKYAKAPFLGTVSICPNDGKELPKLFLCGSNETRTIETGLVNPQLIVWEKFKAGGSCLNVLNTNCANETSAASCWSTVGTAVDYEAKEAGQFRVRIVDNAGVPYTFYFNVYQNTLDPGAIAKNDIIKYGTTCTINGKITVNGFGSGYEYGLTTSTSPPSTWQESNIFDVTAAASYNVFIRLKGVSGSCDFKVPNIVIELKDFSVATQINSPKCSGELGSIRVYNINKNANLQYIYKVSGPTNITTPATTDFEHTFVGLTSGTYTVETTIVGAPACMKDTKTNQVIVVSPSTLRNTTTQTKDLSPCATGVITGSATGGKTPYRYSVNINNAGFVNVANVDGEVVVAQSGTYIVRVEDANGCTADKTFTIGAVEKPTYTVQKVDGNCTGLKGSITVNITEAKGFTDLQYSINNGASYQTSNTFTNLESGIYYVIVQYRKNGVTGSRGSYCTDAPIMTTVGAANPLSASAGIAALSGCGPAGEEEKGLARIVNPQGGIPFPGANPYQYKFMNSPWQNSNEMYIEPGGPYTFSIKDAAGCTYDMTGIYLDPKPAKPEIKILDPVFNCDGSATSTVQVNGGVPDSKYSYKYYIDGFLNPNTPSNVFLNVPQGPHTITVEYTVTSVKTYSNLLVESFGSGGTTTTPGIAGTYCFNDQRVDPPYTCSLNGTPTRSVEDNQYSVANDFWRSDDYDNRGRYVGNGAWYHFKDHTTTGSDPKGRFLLINIGKAAGDYGVLYSKDIVDVIPNQPVLIDLYVGNLLKLGKDGDSPILIFELVDEAGNIVATDKTGKIAEDKNGPERNKWLLKSLSLNPGDNKKLTFKIRSGSTEYGGNDLVMDDIWVRQIPRACGTVQDFDINIDPSKRFNASITGVKDVLCYGDKNGELTINAVNFDPNKGFQYSIDGGLNWATVKPVPAASTGSVTIKNLESKTYDIRVRYEDKAGSCMWPFSQDIKAPPVLDVTASIFKQATCIEGATIRAQASGGTPAYEFELLDAATNAIVKPRQPVDDDVLMTSDFPNIPEGTYIVKGYDKNACTDNINATIVVKTPDPIEAVLATSSNLCYTAANKASITVTVRGGTAPFTYSLNGAPAVGSSTFKDLLPGSYVITVTDGNGCTDDTEAIVIEKELTVAASVTQTLKCATPPATASAVISGEIKGGKAPFGVTLLSGPGTGTFTYPTSTTFTFTASVPGIYTFEISDSQKFVCKTTAEAEIKAPTKPVASAAPENPKCFGAATGSVVLSGSLGSGSGYEYNFNNGGWKSNTTYTGLSANITYSYQVRDDNGCVSDVKTFTLTQPTELKGDIKATEITCNGNKTVEALVTVTATPGTGTGPNYQYSFNNNTSYSDKNTYSTSVAGDVTAYIKDSNGCEIGPLKVTIAALDRITGITITDNGYDCSTTPAGGHVNIAAVKTDVSAPIRYKIISGPAGYDTAQNSDGEFKGLVPGDYIFQAIDIKTGCSFDKEYTVKGIPDIKAGGSVVTSINCFGGTGNIEFTVEGVKDRGYDYVITNALGTVIQQANNVSETTTTITVATALPTGVYTIKATDRKTKCEATYDVTISQPSAAIGVTATATKITCKNGKSDITVVVTGGTKNYTYAVARSTDPKPTAFGTDAVLTVDTNLGANVKWTVYVKDANGCEGNFTVDIESEETPSVTAVLDSQCGPTGTGNIFTITATGSGLAPLKYSIDGTTFKSGNTFNVPAGIYTVTVEDKNGCRATTPTSITISDPLTALASVTKGLDCSPTTPNAEITVDINGGKGSYTYTVKKGTGAIGPVNTITTGPIVLPVTAANADIYEFDITDANGCNIKVNATVLPITNPVVSVKSFANPSCDGYSDGAVELQATGGSGNGYQYNFDNRGFSDTAYYDNLAAGDYSFVVKDGNGCTHSGSITLTAPNKLIVSVDVVPFSCDTNSNKVAGTVTLNVTSGGTAPYKYSFNGGGLSSAVGANVLTLNDNTAGTDQSYTYTVTDANGCSVSGNGVLKALNAPKILEIKGTPIFCQPTTRQASTVTVTKVALTGVDPVTYAIVEPASQTGNVTGATDGVFKDLPVGTYKFKVTDDNGCFAIGTYEVKPVSNIKLVAKISKQVYCKDDNSAVITLEVSNFNTTYKYSINGVETAATSGLSAATITIPNLADGTYNIIVTDEETGCTASDGLIITEPVKALTAIIDQKNANCNVTTSKITVNADGGTGTYTYAFVQDGADPATKYQASNIADLAATPTPDWDVWVKDANGCTVKIDVNVKTDAIPSVTASAVGQCLGDGDYTITANGSGVAPLEYSIDGTNFKTDNKFIVTVAKDYTITVKDANGCTATTITPIHVYEKVTLSAKVDKNITCTVGSEAAKITLTAGGGNPGYTYTSNPTTGTFTSPGVFETTTQGNYMFTVTDANGCSATIPAAVVIKNPTTPVITSVTPVDILCNGATTGALTIVYDNTKGVGPFEINVKQYDDAAHTNLVNDFGVQTTGLPAGYYVVTLKDSNDCTITAFAQIKEPDPIKVVFTTEPLKCTGKGITEGSITIQQVTGGTPNYSYIVTGINNYYKRIDNQTGSARFEIVNFGLYQIRVEDSRGCAPFIIDDVLIAAPVNELDIEVSATADCTNGGKAEVKILGDFAGTGAFHFNIYDGTSQTWIKPANPADPADPDVITNKNNGWIDETFPGSKVAEFTGLTPGKVYTFIIYDESTECYYFQTSEDPIPSTSTLKIESFTPENITCKGANNGNVSFDITNVYATPVDIKYEVFAAFTNNLISTGTRTIPAGGTVTVNQASTVPLPVGTYYILISETSGANAGCGVPSDNFSIKESTVLLTVTASVGKDANCKNLSGIITANAVGGTPFVPLPPLTGPAYNKYMLLLQSDAAPTDPKDTRWDVKNTFNANAGDYTVYALDAYGCIAEYDISLTKDDDPVVDMPAPFCYDGSTPFTITVTGTTDPTIADGPTYSVNGSGWTTDPNFQFNAAGNYNVAIKDGNGCTDTKLFVVYPQLKLKAEKKKGLDCTTTPNAQIELTAEGGEGSSYVFEYSFNGNGYLPATLSAGNIFEATAAGDYTFKVTDTGNPATPSCFVTEKVKIDAIPAIVFDTIETNLTCENSGNGEIKVNVTGGVGPFKFTLTDGTTTWGPQDESVFTGLAAGTTYTVTVQDGTSCTLQKNNIVITQPSALAATADAAAYSCEPGTNKARPTIVTVTVTAGTGTGPYKYKFGTATDYDETNTLSVDGSSFTGTNTISYSVQDANLCVFNGTVDVDAYQGLTGLTITGTDVTCINKQSTVTVVAQGGYPAYTYEIVSPASAIGNVTGKTSGIFTGLDPDTYRFRVTDNNGCSIEDEHTVDPVINITASGANVKNVDCNATPAQANGSVAFTVSNFKGLYTYSVSGPATGTETKVSYVGYDVITVTGLPIGTYTIDIEDSATGCTASAKADVSQPADPIGISIVINTHANCKTGAKVTVKGEGGTIGTGYKYAFAADGAAPVFGPSASSVLDPAKTWKAYVQDVNNCVAEIDIPIVTDPNPTIDSVSKVCYTDGPITVTLSGTVATGTGAPRYNIGNGWTYDDTFRLEAPGDYEFSIMDGNGCTSVTKFKYTLNQKLLLDADLRNDITCKPGAAGDAVIDLTVTQGEITLPYKTIQYSTDGITFVDVPSVPFTTNVAGTYTFKVEDAAGCQAVSTEVIVSDRTTPEFSFKKNDISCFGANNGSFVITPRDGLEPYQYSLDGTTYNNQTEYIGLTPGIYHVYVKDAKECVVTHDIEIIEPGQLIVTPVVTPFGCSTTNAIVDAVVTLNATSGTGTYSYSFDNGVNFSDVIKSITVNAAKTIKYVVVDQNGCRVSGSVDVNPYNPPTEIKLEATPIYCNTPGGFATVTVTEVKGPPTGTAYTYEITSPAAFVASNNTGIFPNLPAGNVYEFKVTDDASHCYATGSIKVDKAPEISVTEQSSNDVFCNGDTTGAITFEISNYITPADYSFNLSPNPLAIVPVQTGDVVTYTGLGTGTYTFTVTDNVSGCTDQVANFLIDQPANPLDFTSVATDINCIKKTALITVTVANGTGTPGYKYAVLEAGDTATPVYGDSNVLEVDTNNGTKLAWDVYVKDLNNCSITKVQNIATAPLPGGITIDPYSQCRDNITGKYSFTVKVATGIAPFKYSINGIDFQDSETFVVDNPGNYTITVKDANGCPVTAPTQVTISDELVLSYSLDLLPSCDENDGEINGSATGGSGTANYVYTLDNNGFPQTGASFKFENVSSGHHYIEVLDTATGCTDRVDFDIDPALPVSGFTVKGTGVTCFGNTNGTITASIDAGALNDGPIKYELFGTTKGSPIRDVNLPKQDSGTFTNLKPGDYTVTAVSERGCRKLLPFRVVEPDLITVDPPVVTQYGCTTDNTTNFATVTIDKASIKGGSGTYTYYQFIKNGTDIVYEGPSNVYTETDFAGGKYTVNVFDSKGCMGTSLEREVFPFVAMDKIDLAITPITCAVNESVVVTVKAFDGSTMTTSLEYTMTGVNGTVFNQTNTNGSFTGLAIGHYLISVRNTLTGCIIKKDHFVNDPNTFDLVAESYSNITCYGAANGSVDLVLVDNLTVPTDDAGEFDYTMTDNLGNTSTGRSDAAGKLTIAGLDAGTYNVKAVLRNPPFCEVETNFTIAQPVKALQIFENHKPISCSPGNDGSIVISADGGWAGAYKYELVGPVSSAYSDTFEFTDLPEGTYTLNVKDVEGCVATTTVVLENPKPITATATATATTLACFGGTDGVITVSAVTGGQGSNYAYILNMLSVTPNISSVAQDSPIFTGLGAGRYSVTIIDQLNCAGTTVEVTINEPAEIVPTLELATGITCKTDATLTLTAVGGTGTYEYSADKNFTKVLGTLPATFSVSVGDHQYFVRDSNGCTSSISNNVTIDQLEPLTLEIDKSNAVVYCKGDSSAAIDALAKGGLTNYMYTLYDGNGVIVRPAQPEGYFDLLPQGTYVVRVDSGDCQYESAAIVITEPAEGLAVTSTATDATCFAANDGKITVTASGGTGIIKYAISPNLGLFDEKSVFDRLAPGKYTILVQDENSCFRILEHEIKEPNLLVGKVVGPIVQEICDGDKDGEFSIEISGGTPPYTVSLDNENGTYVAVNGTQHTFGALKGGIHNVYIKDASCITMLEVRMDNAVILKPVAEVTYDCVNNAQANMVIVTIDASNTNPTDVDYSLDNNGTYQPSNIFTNVPAGDHFIVARHTNGCEVPTPIFTVNAVAELGLVDITNQSKDINTIVVQASGGVAPYEYSFNGEPFTSSNSYRIYKTGDYVVIVRDKNGCEATITVHGTFYDFCMPNYFTPNGDGQNDTIGPDCGALAYKELTFDIYDRYGRVVAKYRVNGKWDGLYHGNELPTGDYWYVLKLNDPKDPREFVGHFTLYR